MTFILFLVLSMLLMMMNLLVLMKYTSEEENSSPFECGFQQINNSRLPFSMSFYLLALIFLVFDVEIALIVPFPMASMLVSLINNLSCLCLFLLLLMGGLVHEWNKSALHWKT